MPACAKKKRAPQKNSCEAWSTTTLPGPSRGSLALLKRDYGQKGTTLTVADATIAAVALVHELTLMTDNVKDFPMKELALYPLPVA